MMKIQYLRGSDFLAAARKLDVDPSVVRAVAEVEARGSGYIKGTNLPCILFEGHHFSKYTDRRFDSEVPHLSYRKWTKVHYKGGRGEYDRLVEAINVNDDNPDPALLSTSWGMFQIMGFNHELAGFMDVRDFVNAMADNEAEHLMAFVNFIIGTGLADELRSKDWARFARGYNGPAYAQNKYDVKMAAAFARKLKEQEEQLAGGEISPERGDAVLLQATLNAALGEDLSEKLVVDGWVGPKTFSAIRKFQKNNGMEPTGLINKDLCEALGISMGAVELEEA